MYRTRMSHIGDIVCVCHLGLDNVLAYFVSFINEPLLTYSMHESNVFSRGSIFHEFMHTKWPPSHNTTPVIV